MIFDIVLSDVDESEIKKSLQTSDLKLYLSFQEIHIIKIAGLVFVWMAKKFGIITIRQLYL